MDWFKNSWLGRKLGLTDGESDEGKKYDIERLKKQIADEKADIADGSFGAVGFSDEDNKKKLAEMEKELEDLHMSLSTSAVAGKIPTIKEEMDKADKGLEVTVPLAYDSNKKFYEDKKAQKDAVAEFEALNLANNDYLAKKGIDTSIFNNVVTDNSQASNANISVVDDSKDGTIIDTSDSRWTD